MDSINLDYRGFSHKVWRAEESRDGGRQKTVTLSS
jgi:hypothetical protein